MKLKDFDFSLPEGLIAQRPSLERGASRLMVLDRGSSTIEHRRFCDIVGYLEPGDLVVLNDTRVIPARLLGRKKTGGKVELLVVEMPGGPDSDVAGRDNRFRAMLNSSKQMKPGTVLVLEDGFEVEVERKDLNGFWECCFLSGAGFGETLERIGRVPLPPYIRREADSDDRLRYQTIYASKAGAVAAPTAGLHFTSRLFDQLKDKGIEVRSITLHVGPATFAPIRVDDVRTHKMGGEYYFIEPEVFDAVRRAGVEGRRVVAVGTTTARALESAVKNGVDAPKLSGESRLFIYPGFDWKVVDALVTNFHLPRSTLIMLAASFAGTSFLLDAYREAVKREYRFYSYGDAMFIL